MLAEGEHSRCHLMLSRGVPTLLVSDTGYYIIRYPIPLTGKTVPSYSTLLSIIRILEGLL